MDDDQSVTSNSEIVDVPTKKIKLEAGGGKIFFFWSTKVKQSLPFVNSINCGIQLIL
jgi:hypothetical protein